MQYQCNKWDKQFMNFAYEKKTFEDAINHARNKWIRLCRRSKYLHIMLLYCNLSATIIWMISYHNELSIYIFLNFLLQSSHLNYNWILSCRNELKGHVFLSAKSLKKLHYKTHIWMTYFPHVPQIIILENEIRNNFLLWKNLFISSFLGRFLSLISCSLFKNLSKRSKCLVFRCFFKLKPA